MKLFRLMVVVLAVVLFSGTLPVSHAAPPSQQYFYGPMELGAWSKTTGDLTVKSVDGPAYTLHFGLPNDIPVPGNYRGDFVKGFETVFAVWRPSNGTWYMADGDPFSATSLPVAQEIQLGAQGDTPVPADYDGDGTTEIGYWHPQTGVWTIALENRVGAGAPMLTAQTGQQGDIPIPGDYDGDGKDEIAVWRPSDHTFYVSLENKDWAGNPVLVVKMDGAGENPIRANFDQDAADELGIWRASDGKWAICLDSTQTLDPKNYLVIQTGQQGDVPIPGDYDGNGVAEVAVWRPSDGTLFVNFSGVDWAKAPADKAVSYKLGVLNAIPVPAQYHVETIR